MSTRQLTLKLYEFFKMQTRVEKAPGFSSALGLDYNTLLKDENVLSVDENGVITLRYRVTPQRLLPNSAQVSLSTYLAAVDDVTTWALVLGDEKRSRPGKSVSLNLWAGPFPQEGRHVGDEVNISASVHKIGRNLGFCGAEISNADTGNVVCFASHIKYLPMGPLFDMALSSYGWKAATLYTDHFLPSPSSDNIPPLTDLFESLTFTSDATATFHVLPIHASLGGPIHGGCQAVLMELVATQVARRQLDCNEVTLTSIQVEYMSPPSSKTIELHTQVLSKGSKSLVLRVKLMGGEKTMSQGILCFSREILEPN